MSETREQTTVAVPLVDTHAHLTADTFAPDLDAVLERARAVGVARVIVVSETAEESRAALALAAQQPMVRAAVGLFPTHLDLAQAAEIETLAVAHRDQLVAIGEVGLDYWKVQDGADRELQHAILARFVALANALELPLNVHSRSAGHHTIRFLSELGARKVQLHAFDGKASATGPALEAGWFFSVPPSVVRSPQKQRLVRRVPIQHLLLETDSPVLGPEPSERNEPANLLIALHAIAELKELPVSAVAELVLENTRRLYGASIA